MTHDLVAELGGLRNELASVAAESPRSKLIREQIGRVEGLIRDRLASLDAHPTMIPPEVAEEAARLRVALPVEDEPADDAPKGRSRKN